MRAELQNKLIEDFPWMDPGRADSREPYVHFGIQIGDGWYQLLHDLCQEITDRFKQDGVEPDIIVCQVKEKFAGLRFYFEFEDAPIPFAAIDVFGQGSMRLEPENMDDLDEATRKRVKDIFDIVGKCERKSLTVCEFCGGAGKQTKGGWIKTSCDPCWEKYMAERMRGYAEGFPATAARRAPGEDSEGA